MQSNRTELLFKKKTTNLQCVLNKSKCNEFATNEPIGGILKNGQIGWIGLGPHLDIVSLKNGNKVAEHTFQIPAGAANALITCVVEIEIPDVNTLILAIGIQYFPVGGMICLFSVCGSRILRCIELIDKITCCRFVPENLYKRTGVHVFDGCLVVGTNVGKVFFINLYLNKCKEVLLGGKCNKNDLTLIRCQTILANVNLSQLKSLAKDAKKDNIHLAIGLEVIENSGSVLSLLLIPQQLTLIVGLDDGRMILYDLTDLQAYHLAYPPENYFPLINLAYIEPADDPRACIYVWAFHNNNKKSSVAVMHSIMFERKRLNGTEWNYDKFQSCSVRLTIPFNDHSCKPVSCQGITKYSAHDEDTMSLCLLTLETSDKKINMLVFDLNQWYKEQMPEYLNINKLSNCLAYFTLGETNALDVWMDVRSVTPFCSVQRPEEHFYPNALSFECILFTGYSCDFVYWPGIQNKVLDLLNTIGPKAVFEPENCYNAIINAALLPCFWEEHNFNSNASINKKRELIMTIALEYNCIGLLKKCATLWSDGSHLGDNNSYSGVSLSTLTDWIWAHSIILKDNCNLLCLPLFDHSERQIDNRTQKQLSHCSRQLLLLSDLLEYILLNCRNYIPHDVCKTLQYQQNSIRMSFEYQEVLQWLVNIGLLPENAYNPYPYTLLNNFYRSQRYKFSQTDNKISSQVTKTSKNTALSYSNLFIDSFIKYECNDKELKNQWKESLGLYPPISLQQMLRILLVPNMKIENKYILILYLFLDLSIALDEERHGNIIENLIKFPSVFNLNPSVIKRTQAFWKLDHGQFEAALDELFSPLSGNNNLVYWQHELLIETLLHQDVPSLALQALRSQSTPVNSLLEIKTLLANGFVSEAFDVQRLKGDVQLLREFYKICFNTTKWIFILQLALTESEGRILCEYLNEIDTNSSEIFHVIYLLQRSKYMEAVDFINKLEKTKNTNNILETETSKLILSAYNLTMTPTVKTITKSYLTFCERSKSTKINKKPLPFSTKLIKNKIDLTNGIYQRAFDSIADCDQSFLNGSIENVPFIRKSIKNRDLLFRKNENLIVPKLIFNSRCTDENNKNRNKNKRRLSSASSSSLEDLPIIKKPHFEETKNKNSRISLLTNFKEKKVKNTKIFSSTLNDSLRLIDNKNVKEFGRNYLTNRLNESRNLLMTQTPPSILKQQHEELPSSSTLSTSIVVPTKISILKQQESDEKSIKFNISEPISINSSAGSAYLGPTKRASLRLSDVSCKSSSMDEFYSPDNSKFDNELDDRPDECTISPIIVPQIIVEMEEEVVPIVAQNEEKNEIGEQRISPKSNDVPLKRRALRSCSKTPERQTRGRSKTPEVSLTPYRKSIRLMERSMQQESKIHELIIEEEQEVNNETIPENDLSSFIIPSRNPVLTDDTMMHSDELNLETSESDFDVSSIKKKIIFEEDDEQEHEVEDDNETQTESELNLDNSVESPEDSNNEEDKDEDVEVEENMCDEPEEEHEINFDDDVEEEEFPEDDIVFNNDDVEEEEEEGEVNEEQDDEEENDVENEQDDEQEVEEEEEEEEENDDDESIELNTSLESQQAFRNEVNEESQSESSSSSSSAQSKSTASSKKLSQDENDVINILSSSEEEEEEEDEEESEINILKSSKSNFNEAEQSKKCFEQNLNTNIVATHNYNENQEEVQLTTKKIDHQLDVEEHIEENPVYHQMESADNVSSMLYDNIDYEMEEPDNMNNALLINFSCSQDSSQLQNSKAIINENAENADIVENIETLNNDTTLNISAENQSIVIINETLISDPMNDAQIISLTESHEEDYMEDLIVENEVMQSVSVDNKDKVETELKLEYAPNSLETSLIIEDQSVSRIDVLNTNIGLCQQNEFVDEDKETKSIAIIVSDEREINDSVSNLLNKNIEVREEMTVIVDEEKHGEAIIETVENAKLDTAQSVKETPVNNIFEEKQENDKDIIRERKHNIIKELIEKQETPVISESISSSEIANIEVGKLPIVLLETKQNENMETKELIDEKNIKKSSMRVTRARSASTEIRSQLENSPMPARRTKRSNSSTNSGHNEKHWSLDPIDENAATSTPTRMTRRSSMLALDKTPTATTVTPQKNFKVHIENISKRTPSRRSSVDRESNSSLIEEIGEIKTPRRSSSRLGMASSISNEDLRTPKRTIDKINQNEQSPDNEEAIDYSLTRRLTRSQLSMMEKMQKYKNSGSSSKKIKTHAALDESIESEAYGSDTESNISNSTVGTNTSTRSKSRKLKEEDKMSDTSSVAGSTKSKRGRPRKTPILESIVVPLSVIQEDSENDEDKPKKKLGRPRKNSTSSRVSTSSRK